MVCSRGAHRFFGVGFSGRLFDRGGFPSLFRDLVAEKRRRALDKLRSDNGTNDKS